MNEPAGARPPRAALWFALLGGPLAWTAHLLASYPLVPVSCRLGTTAPLNALTAVAALIAAAAAATGTWAYRRARPAPDVPTDPASSARFMALCGLLLASLFTFAILVEGLPPILQDPCSRGL